jgi:hypothetical protein
MEKIHSLLDTTPAPKDHAKRNVVITIVVLAGLIGTGVYFALRALGAI